MARPEAGDGTGIQRQWRERRSVFSETLQPDMEARGFRHVAGYPWLVTDAALGTDSGAGKVMDAPRHPTQGGAETWRTPKYLRSGRRRMRYGAAGHPIGSGEVDVANRVSVTRRSERVHAKAGPRWRSGRASVSCAAQIRPLRTGMANRRARDWPFQTRPETGQSYSERQPGTRYRCVIRSWTRKKIMIAPYENRTRSRQRSCFGVFLELESISLITAGAARCLAYWG